jgi:hypothetical protein
MKDSMIFVAAASSSAVVVVYWLLSVGSSAIGIMRLDIGDIDLVPAFAQALGELKAWSSEELENDELRDYPQFSSFKRETGLAFATPILSRELSDYFATSELIK